MSGGLHHHAVAATSDANSVNSSFGTLIAWGLPWITGSVWRPAKDGLTIIVTLLIPRLTPATTNKNAHV